MLHRVPVVGGELTVEVIAGRSQPILAIHAITSTRRLFDTLRAAAPELSLILPDLRGRGASVDVTGPSSIAQHAEDMMAVLSALDIGAAHVCGMSMGGFVAVEMAARYPDLVRSVTLVDGGFPITPPEGLTRETMRAVLQEGMGRLTGIWGDAADNAELDEEAVVGDTAGMLFEPSLWLGITAPIRLVYAEWGAAEGSPPAYTAERVAGYADRLTSFISARRVAGVTHPATITSEQGASAVAEALRHALGR